jgi:hypothetical protein
VCHQARSKRRCRGGGAASDACVLYSLTFGLLIIEFGRVFDLSSFRAQLGRDGFARFERRLHRALLLVDDALLAFETLTMEVLATQTSIATQHDGSGGRKLEAGQEDASRRNEEEAKRAGGS